MRNMGMVVLAAVIAGAFIFGAAHLAPDAAAQAAAKEKGVVVDAGNKTCPVTGDAVNGKDFYVYKGKRYGLCCPMCVGVFGDDPEKYSAIAEKEIAGK